MYEAGAGDKTTPVQSNQCSHDIKAEMILDMAFKIKSLINKDDIIFTQNPNQLDHDQFKNVL